MDLSKQFQFFYFCVPIQNIRTVIPSGGFNDCLVGKRRRGPSPKLYTEAPSELQVVNLFQF